MKSIKKSTLFSAIIGCFFSSSFAQDACLNAALNSPSTANSSTATEPPNLAFDGDLTTNWCTPQFTGWITVELPDESTINEVKLHVNQAISGNTIHEIKVSDDMENWTLVNTLSGYTSNDDILTVNFNPALSNVRGVMINTTQSNSWVGWYEIKVYSSPSKPTIIQNGAVLTSSSTINNQWYLNGSPIPDETSQYYTVTSSGAYQVGVSNENGCESMSDITNVFATGINNITEKDVKIYPNPAKDNIIIEGATKGTLEILNSQGQIIKHLNISDNKTSIDISKLTIGVYSLKIITKQGIIIKKLLKE